MKWLLTEWPVDFAIDNMIEWQQMHSPLMKDSMNECRQNDCRQNICRQMTADKMDLVKMTVHKMNKEEMTV